MDNETLDTLRSNPLHLFLQESIISQLHKDNRVILLNWRGFPLERQVFWQVLPQKQSSLKYYLERCTYAMGYPLSLLYPPFPNLLKNILSFR